MRLAPVLFLLAALSASAVAATAPPKDPPAADNARDAMNRAIGGQLHPAYGDVAVPAADVTLHLGRKYYFLKGSEAQLILKSWGNSQDALNGVLGMILPAGKTFSDNTWAAVVTYDADGYVADTDAQSADYDAVLKSVQDAEGEINMHRKAQQLEPIHVVGWAQQPSYDPSKHTMIWARDIKFGDQTNHTLNYDLRSLGRRGILSLNLVSVMSDLANVRASATELEGVAAFNAGARYADYNEGSDKKAEYGIAGLVAAGVGGVIAQKVGLFGLAILFFKKAAVFILAAFGGIGAWLRRMFGGKKNDGAPPSLPPAGG